VSVSYGQEEVLQDVSLEIGRGEFLPFIGANGSGKTTLLRATLGLIKPRKGRIITPFPHSPPGYVPQQRSIDPLYPVSVRQIVAMGLYPQVGVWGRPNSVQKGIVQQALDQFGLADHASRTFSRLSGGMKQKVLIARALVSGAEVFVMDEPSSELDEPTEKELLLLLFRLCKDEGKTVLLAHHGLNMVTGLATRICTVKRRGVHIMSFGEAAAQLNVPRSTNKAASEEKGDRE
jgi:ABC-type Mn2+/Zn2+ transport system ATPase subunit